MFFDLILFSLRILETARLNLLDSTFLVMSSIDQAINLRFILLSKIYPVILFLL